MKKGFTLAEVLITLAIIGVVAAFAIPTLINKYQRQVTVEKIKIAYSTITKILQAAEAKQGSITSWDVAKNIKLNPSDNEKNAMVDEFVDKYMAPYMSVQEIARKELKDFGYKNGITCASGSSGVAASYVAKGIQLKNGMFMYVYIANSGSGSTHYTTRINFGVDLDGPYHGVNTTGKDVFYFTKYFTNDAQYSRLMMEGLYTSTFDIKENVFTNYEFNSREDLLNQCKNKTGTHCGALIMKDGWKISSDYPWL